MKRIVIVVSLVALYFFTALASFGGAAHAAAHQHVSSQLPAHSQQQAATPDLFCPVMSLMGPLGSFSCQAGNSGSFLRELYDHFESIWNGVTDPFQSGSPGGSFLPLGDTK